MPQQNFEEFVGAQCEAKLAEFGMRRVTDGTLEIDLSARFVGWVGLPRRKLKGAPGGPAVLVTPMVGARDREVGRLAAELQGLPESDPAARPHYVIVKELSSLIPERGPLPPEWVASREEGDVAQVARQIAQDVVFAGFPYMQGLASPDAYFKEFKDSPRRTTRPRESAITYMMHGELEDAKRMLWRLALPVLQNPTVLDDGDAAVSFFAAFASYFGVDLGIGDWPVRKQAQHKPMIGIRIHRGVVPTALALVDRNDLAERGAALTEAEMERIGARASEILAASEVKDPSRAIGLAAVEFLTAH
ncbi:MAG: hypothetical protein JWM19_4316, partial [Actinomycetia bacterium]|nr:hypothetical protein [Actinomycetes bacterium]